MPDVPFTPGETTKAPAVVLVTRPVHLPGVVFPGGGGTVTTIDCGWPLVL